MIVSANDCEVCSKKSVCKYLDSYNVFIAKLTKIKKMDFCSASITCDEYTRDESVEEETPPINTPLKNKKLIKG